MFTEGYQNILKLDQTADHLLLSHWEVLFNPGRTKKA